MLSGTALVLLLGVGGRSGLHGSGDGCVQASPGGAAETVMFYDGNSTAKRIMQLTGRPILVVRRDFAPSIKA